ncbi:MAG: sodium:proton antiporter NhaD [Pseudomonadota bacterium]|nr:sodium:proton antiporter [Gammaproteobacteria bacterium]MEC8011707.1 sodium:proton antiporter NhaD [Pseudomonadota bacterium]
MSCLPFLASTAFAAGATTINHDFTSQWLGIVCLIIFVIAFVLVIFEEQLHLAKSKPLLLAAGVIWVLIAATGIGNPNTQELIEKSLKHNFLEYAELFFFLLVSMTYLNAMLERGIFDSLRDWLIQKGLSYKSIFWLTGFLAFFISSVANNLTTAMVMCAVVLAVAPGQSKFICLTCINTIVASNAGGAFSPFGDITTLMVWQKGVIPFTDFFLLFLPALANFVIPAFIMQFAVQKGSPEAVSGEKAEVKPGGKTMVFLFLITIVTAVVFSNTLGMPPVFGMMMGLAYLKLYSYYLQIKSNKWEKVHVNPPKSREGIENPYSFDIFEKIANSEWDTLFFFYGIILAVGGLGYLGYLNLASHMMYTELGPMNANILVGLLSSVVDNIPVMFAVLTMNPDMSEFHWLLVTLTAGVGGSLLSVGSAAGVALMGQARGHYNFMKHLKWAPVIALGYFGSIGVHWLLNS